MEGEQFKNLMGLLKLVGGKFIIVEDGEPRAVLMSYEEFDKLAAPQATRELAERINSVITKSQLFDLRDEVIVEEPAAPESEITIEPL